MSKPHEKIAVLGGGIMGETIIAGILAAGWSGERVILSEQRAEVAPRIAERHRVIRAASDPQAVVGADVIVLPVRPQGGAAVVGEISWTLAPPALLSSVPAGLSSQWFAHRLPTNQPV